MPASAEDIGSVPGPRRFHIPQSNCDLSTTTTGASVPRACDLQQEKPSQWENHVPQRRVAPCSSQLEKAHAQQQRQPNKWIN